MLVAQAKKILVIEDDPDIGNMLEINLREEGYAVELANNGELGLQRLREAHYDLLVLDVMLPGVNGLDVCREVRRKDEYQPIIILSARSSETQRVIGLELGADDYLTKPFSIVELAARIRALLRRVEAIRRPADAEASITFGELNINPGGHRVIVYGQEIALTGKEFELLLFFARHPGQAFSRLALLDQIWGYNHDGYEHTVNTHINRLRAKIETDPANPRYIQTVWGVGYKFADSNSEAARPDA